MSTTVGSFLILIANEAHESWQDERHKLITDKNSYYIPKNLRIPQGTTITFLNADAPWDTPHPQTVEITEADGGEVVYSTGTLDYTNSSEPRVLPVGNYTIINTEYEATEGTISVDDHSIVSNRENSWFRTVCIVQCPGTVNYLSSICLCNFNCLRVRCIPRSICIDKYYSSSLRNAEIFWNIV